MECPICGYKFGRGWSQCDNHVFEQAVESLGPSSMGGPVAVIPPGVTLERWRPARAADLRSDVAVPCIQAAITGLLAAIGGGGLAAVVGLDVPIAGLVVGGIAMGATWYSLLRQHRDLLWERETITGMDLDGDGSIGKPAMTKLEVTIPNDEGRQVKIMELDATPEQLRTLARGMLHGRMAETEWYGKGRLFSKGKFYALREELIERGLMVWVNPTSHTQGTELTAVGRAVFRRLVT